MGDKVHVNDTIRLTCTYNVHKCIYMVKNVYCTCTYIWSHKLGHIRIEISRLCSDRHVHHLYSFCNHKEPYIATSLCVTYSASFCTISDSHTKLSPDNWMGWDPKTSGQVEGLVCSHHVPTPCSWVEGDQVWASGRSSITMLDIGFSSYGI